MLFRSIVASNFLAHARVLANTLAEHHRGARIEVLVVDAPEEPTRDGEPFSRLGLREAGLSTAELHRLATAYGAQALISSLNARVLAAALAHGRGPAVLLDADMLALGPLDDAFQLAERHSIVLTPHSAVPLPYEVGGDAPELT